MSLKAFGLGLSAAAAFSAVVVLEAPVQAATIAGANLSFGSSAKLSNVGVGNIATLDFIDSSSAFGTPGGTATILSNSPFGSLFSTFSIGDLALERTTASSWSLSGGSITWLSGLADGIGFTLETFNLTRNPSGSFEATVAGFFTPSGLNGDGSFTAQGNLAFRQGSSFSADITAVPTPALLPGLVGLGVAALRKRSSEDESEQA